MRIAIFGGTGELGSRLVAEALRRGHSLTMVLRRPDADCPEGIDCVVGDVTDPDSIAAAVAGHDAVISAVGGAGDGNPRLVVEAAHALIEGLSRARVGRLAVVGGAGSLLTESGVERVDSSDFPDAWKPSSEAQRDALEVYRRDGEALEWSYLSPADLIEPGERTGRFSLGVDHMVVDSRGVSRISIEDYAVALLDELDQDRFVRARFTVGYA